MKNEQVLCFKRELLNRLGYFTGISFDVERYWENITNPLHVVYKDRATVEQDESYLQLIPYVLVMETNGGDRILHYKRAKSGGESRLHDLWSIGIGGHISVTDTINPGQYAGYQDGMIRELHEEIGFPVLYDNIPPAVALINDDSTPVGRVHFGVVHILLVDNGTFFKFDKDIADAEFVPIIQAVNHSEQYEGWSKICLNNMFSILNTEAFAIYEHKRDHRERGL